MSRRARWSPALLAAVATAVVVAPAALAHGGNSDPNSIHACVNRVGEVRILGFTGYPGGIDGVCPSLGGPWAIVHWPAGPSGGATGASASYRRNGPERPLRPAGNDRSNWCYRSNGSNGSNGSNRRDRSHRS